MEKALNGVVREAIAGEMKGLHARLDSIERDQESHGRLLGSMGAPQTEQDPDEPKAQADVIWPCIKCGSRLGFYDQRADVVRCRYKEHILHTRLGPGGWLKVVCRQCGEINSIDYTPGIGVEGVPVSEGMIVLDVETLAGLLQVAQNSQSGDVTIPVVFKE